MHIASGIDIVDINQITKIYNKYKTKFIQKILTTSEQIKINSHISPTQTISFLAKRFAAKEAIVKALKTGISKKYHFKNISILNTKNGAPIVYINNKLKKNISISLSSNNQSAIAMCNILSH